MENKITTSVPGLISASEQAIGGVATYGAAINIKQNTVEVITADKDALEAADEAYDIGAEQASTARAVRKSVCESARLLVVLLRDLLKKNLGVRYSEKWNILGYQGSIQVPRKQVKLLPLLIAAKNYLVAHPEIQNTDLELTEARAEGLRLNLIASQNAVNLKEGAAKQLLRDRNAAVRAMRKRLRSLANELEGLIDPLDTRWLSFGFNMPGAQQTPDAPTQVTAVSHAAGRVEVAFPPAPRAEHYRVFKRVVGGQSQDFDPVGSPTDPNLTLTEQASGTQLEICVSAVNNGGESAKSAIVTVTVA
jgi:hypothetical protein